MNRIFTIIAPALLLFAGCASTDFYPQGKTVIFTEVIDSRASKVILTAGSSNVASIVPLTEMLSTGRSQAQPSVVQKNIVAAAQPKNLVNGIGMGLKEVFLGLGATETKETRMSPDQFVAESKLLRCEVKESSEEILILINAEATVKNHETGSVVWSESAEERVKLVPIRDGKRIENASVADVATLISGSEEEITEAVKAATATVGRTLAQKLRKAAPDWGGPAGRAPTR